MAIYSELPVYRDSYRLLLEIYKVTNTFSREYKFSLGQDMRRDTLSLFRNLYRANKNQDKRVFLEAFLDDFELLKLQIRVCLDLKLLSYIIVRDKWWSGKIYFDIIKAKFWRGIFMELKDKLQLLRKQNGYSQEQLADKLGIARQTLSKWENGV